MGCRTPSTHAVIDDRPRLPREHCTHMHTTKLTAAVLAAAASTLVLAACGGSNNDAKSGDSSAGSTAANGLADVGTSSDQKRGGTLHVVSAEGWEHLDPGQSYFQI